MELRSSNMDRLRPKKQTKKPFSEDFLFNARAVDQYSHRWSNYSLIVTFYGKGEAYKSFQCECSHFIIGESEHSVETE